MRSRFGVLYHGARPNPKKDSGVEYRPSYEDFAAMQEWGGVRPRDWYYVWEPWERIAVLAFLREKHKLDAAMYEYQIEHNKPKIDG